MSRDDLLQSVTANVACGTSSEDFDCHDKQMVDALIVFPYFSLSTKDMNL